MHHQAIFVPPLTIFQIFSSIPRYIYDHMDDLGELADASIQDVGFIKGSVISVGASKHAMLPFISLK